MFDGGVDGGGDDGKTAARNCAKIFVSFNTII